MIRLLLLLILTASVATAQSRKGSDEFVESMGSAIARDSAYAIGGSTTPLSGVHKFGRHPAVNTGDLPVDIYDCSSVSVAHEYQWGAAAEPYYVSSSNAGNTEDFTVSGLDEDYLEKTETVTLSGVTTVPLPGLWTRVNRAFTVGPTALVGTVYVHDQADAGADGVPDAESNYRSCVLGPIGQTLQAIYTVPANFTGYVHQLCLGVNSISGGATEVASFNVSKREFGGTWRTIHIYGLTSIGAGSQCFDYVLPIALPPKTDVRARVFYVATSGVDVYATFDIVLWPY